MTFRLLAVIAVLAMTLAACGTGGEEATTPDTDVDTTDTDTGTDTDVDTDTDLETDTELEGVDTDIETDSGTDADATEEPDTATGTATPETIARAVDTTVAEGSATFDATVDISTDELSDTVTSSGVVDFDGDRRQLEVEGPTGTIQTLATADGLMLGLGEGAGWVRVDPTQLQGTPLEAYGLATLPLQDPSVNLALLRGATDDVEDMGSDTVDGEELQHYRVVVDIDQAAAQVDDPEAQQAVTDVRRQTGTDTVEMMVWIDEDDLIRRMSQTVDLADAELTEEGVTGTVDITVDLSGFGQDVTITEPEEGEIVDIDEQTLQDLLTAQGM